jgi:hypothetical protein
VRRKARALRAFLPTESRTSCAACAPAGEFGIPERQERVCQCCDSGVLGDERHVLLECRALQSVRDRHAHLFASPRMVKLFMWQADLYGVACFICECMGQHDLITNGRRSSASLGLRSITNLSIIFGWSCTPPWCPAKAWCEVKHNNTYMRGLCTTARWAQLQILRAWLRCTTLKGLSSQRALDAACAPVSGLPSGLLRPAPWARRAPAASTPKASTCTQQKSPVWLCV